jgi:hypothetical protein
LLSRAPARGGRTTVQLRLTPAFKSELISAVGMKTSRRPRVEAEVKIGVV